VTALAGALSLEDSAILGIAMGSSEAAGYVNENGMITGWLNELAFAPIDYRPNGPVDEWSGDAGCGVEYLSQMGVVRVAGLAGIDLSAAATPAEKLKVVQSLHDAGNPVARKVFESIGVFLGYALAHYAEFYHIRHVLILGRVTSGEGGPVVKSLAERVLRTEFPEVASAITMHLPEDEKGRRVGQAVAAASLPAGSRTQPGA
jgi:predicted NBD/HSP70 family sugar kinase